MLSPKAAGDVVLDHVSRRFGALSVLDDVSLTLTPGSITEIVGNNGAGKISMLRMERSTGFGPHDPADPAFGMSAYHLIAERCARRSARGGGAVRRLTQR